jgi:hypothetical protein
MQHDCARIVINIINIIIVIVIIVIVIIVILSDSCSCISNLNDDDSTAFSC